MANIDFAALLCSRLCHDLVSPVGAINNGLEVLQDEQEASMREAVLDLIEKSTHQTSNKLQFFRLAFGAAGGFSAQLDVRECEKAMRSFLSGSRVELDWQIDLTSAPKSLVKILLNVGLVVSESLIRGGKLRISTQRSGDEVTVLVVGEGQRVILQKPVRDAMEGVLAEEDLDPRAAPAFLAHSVAKETGGKIVVEALGETNIVVKATCVLPAKTGGE